MVSRPHQPMIAPALKGYLATVQRCLHQALGERELGLVLFGSCARGQQRPGSDIDLLLVVPSNDDAVDAALSAALGEVRRSNAQQVIERLGLEPTPAIVVHSLTRFSDHPLLLLDVATDGEILFDRNGVVADHLERVRQSMARHGSHRLALPDGSWCWELKPGMRPGEELSW